MRTGRFVGHYSLRIFTVSGILDLINYLLFEFLTSATAPKMLKYNIKQLQILNIFHRIQDFLIFRRIPIFNDSLSYPV